MVIDLSWVSLSMPCLHLFTTASLSLCYLCQTDMSLHKNVLLYNPVKGHFPFYSLLVVYAYFYHNKCDGIFRN